MFSRLADDDTLSKLKTNDQILFQYSSPDGEITDLSNIYLAVPKEVGKTDLPDTSDSRRVPLQVRLTLENCIPKVHKPKVRLSNVRIPMSFLSHFGKVLCNSFAKKLQN